MDAALGQHLDLHQAGKLADVPEKTSDAPKRVANPYADSTKTESTARLYPSSRKMSERKAFDYSHALTPDMRDNGYRVIVYHHPTTAGVPIIAEMTYNGKRVGVKSWLGAAHPRGVLDTFEPGYDSTWNRGMVVDAIKRHIRDRDRKVKIGPGQEAPYLDTLELPADGSRTAALDTAPDKKRKSKIKLPGAHLFERPSRVGAIKVDEPDASDLWVPNSTQRTGVTGSDPDTFWDYSDRLPVNLRNTHRFEIRHTPGKFDDFMLGEIRSREDVPGTDTRLASAWQYPTSDKPNISWHNQGRLSTPDLADLRGVIENAFVHHNRLRERGQLVPQHGSRTSRLELKEHPNLPPMAEDLRKGPPPLPPDALKRPAGPARQGQPAPADAPKPLPSPWDVESSAPAPTPLQQAVQAAPRWLDRYPVVHPDHIQELETEAAVNEFGRKLPREQAEAEAHSAYTKRQREAAMLHHLRGMQAADAAGAREDARKHSAMYQLHAKALGHDPVGPVPAAVLAHGESAKPPYRFKPHKGDLFAAQPPLTPEPGIISSAPAPQLGKAEARREGLYRIWQAGQAVLKKGGVVKFPGNPAPPVDRGKEATATSIAPGRGRPVPQPPEVGDRLKVYDHTARLPRQMQQSGHKLFMKDSPEGRVVVLHHNGTVKAMTRQHPDQSGTITKGNVAPVIADLMAGIFNDNFEKAEPELQKGDLVQLPVKNPHVDDYTARLYPQYQDAGYALTVRHDPEARRLHAQLSYKGKPSGSISAPYHGGWKLAGPVAGVPGDVLSEDHPLYTNMRTALGYHAEQLGAREAAARSRANGESSVGKLVQLEQQTRPTESTEKGELDPGSKAGPCHCGAYPWGPHRRGGGKCPHKQ